MSDDFFSGHVRFHADLEPLMVDIDTVTQHPRNYNNGDTDAIIESIRVNGMYRPIYVSTDTGEIIAGNHTWMACKELGATRIPVVRLKVNEEQVMRMMVGDNRIAELARPDEGQLLDILKEIATTETGLSGTGFTDLAFGDLLEALDNADTTGFSLPETGSELECPSCGHTWKTTV